MGLYRDQVHWSSEQVPCPIAWHAIHHPDSPAIHRGRDSWTYAELDNRIRTTEFDSDGHMLVFQEWNSPDLVVRIFSAWRAGKTVLLLNPRLPEQAVHRLTEELDGRRVSATVRDQATTSEARYHSVSIATAMLTSGSTGKPSVVGHSFVNHISSAYACMSELDMDADDSWLWSLPAFHVGGLSVLWRCFCSGASVVYKPRQKGPLNLEMGSPSICSVVSTQLSDLVAAQICSPTSLKNMIVGGGPLSEGLLRKALELGYPVRTTFGMTETTSMVTLSEQWSKSFESLHAGRALEGVSLTLGDEGNLIIRGPMVCAGFYEKGEFKAVEAQKMDSKDQGSLLPDGALQLAGRSDGVFISGGENISTGEIERAILAMDDIDSCRVIAVPDERYGRRPVAFVSPDLGSAYIKTFLRGKLPSFSIPDRFYSFPDLEPGEVKVPSERLLDIAKRDLTSP